MRRKVSYQIPWYILSVIYSLTTLACNIPTIILTFHYVVNYPIASKVIIIATIITLIISTSLLLTTLFAFKYIMKLFITLSLMANGIVLYFMNTMKIVIDRRTIINILETNLHETRELITIKLIFYIVIAGFLASTLFFVKIRFHTLKKEIIIRTIILIAASTTIGAILLLNKPFISFWNVNPDIKYMIIPENYIGSAIQNLALTMGKNNEIAIGQDAHLVPQSRKKTIVLLVVGESARASNFSLNEYNKKTNPYLEKEFLVSFRNTYSYSTSTSYSVPCMFSHLGCANFDSSFKHYYNLTDILQKVGISVAWTDNNTGCKGVCNRIKFLYPNSSDRKQYCKDAECYDDIMLNPTMKYINDNKNNNIFIVLHMFGSHGPAYYLRYPKEYEQFTPSCRSSDVISCKSNELNNAYNNTIIYTDHFLAQTINILKPFANTHNIAMIYISDHGESLGENGNFLHGIPYEIAPKDQIHIPFIVWSSKYNKYLTRYKNEQMSHNNIFHSILGIFHVKTSLYNKELDIFAGYKQ